MPEKLSIKKEGFEYGQVIKKKEKNSFDNLLPAALERTMENNMSIKAAMVTELVDMGLSLKAIERILHLEPEVLDRLL